MKKILLSCVTCLLALGLVTACNNEDEDVSGGGGDSNTQDTGTGGGSDTGSGGGTNSGGGSGDVTTLYNYTLELTLTDEDGNDPIPSYATAYIIGDWDNWGEFLPLKGGDKVYSYTFESITVGWHNFKGVMWYTDEEVGWEGKCVEIVTVPYVDEETGETVEDGNAYFEVVASQGDGSKCQLEYTVTATLEERIVNVTGVSIAEGTSIVMAPNDTKQLTAVVTPSNATDQSVTWAVKEEEGDTEPNDPVVSVDQQTGLVTAGASMGTATIVVTTTDGGYTAETEVYVISAESIIENYTLTITLDTGVTIPEYAELYLLYNGSYTLLKFSEGTATASLGSVVIGATISYSVYLDYSEEYRAMEGCPEVTESNIALSETHTVAEGETGVSGEITSILTLVDPTTVASEIVAYFYFYQDDEHLIPEAVPYYLEPYIQWTTDEWTSSNTPIYGGSGQLTATEETGVYTYTFKDSEAFTEVGTASYTLYLEPAGGTDGEAISYSNQYQNLTFEIPYFTAAGATISADVVVGDIAAAHPDPNDESNQCTYVLGFKDTSSSPSSVSTSSWVIQGSGAGLAWSDSSVITATGENYDCYYEGVGVKGDQVTFDLLPSSSNDWTHRLFAAADCQNNTNGVVYIDTSTGHDISVYPTDQSWKDDAVKIVVIFEFDFTQFTSSNTSGLCTAVSLTAYGSDDTVVFPVS